MAELQTGPLPELFANSICGVERLNLAVAEPKPTTNFSLCDYGGASFQPRGVGAATCAAWQLEPGGYLRFKLMLPYQQGVVLLSELCSPMAAEPTGCPFTLKVNEAEWRPEFDADEQDFQPQSWYLLHYLLEAGDNFITLRLTPEASTPLLIRSAAVMRFNLQMQQQTKWCWAAVTASLLSFFNAQDATKQCQVVKQFFGQPQNGESAEADCCQSGLAEVCNKTFKLSQALESINLLEACESRPLTIKELRRRIGHGVPLPIRIGWRDRTGKLSNSGHFVMITAVGPDDPRGDDFTWVRVADPKDKVASYLAYGALKDSYKGQGQWTHSYLLRKEGLALSTA